MLGDFLCYACLFLVSLSGTQAFYASFKVHSCSLILKGKFRLIVKLLVEAALSLHLLPDSFILRGTSLLTLGNLLLPSFHISNQEPNYNQNAIYLEKNIPMREDLIRYINGTYSALHYILSLQASKSIFMLRLKSKLNVFQTLALKILSDCQSVLYPKEKR